MAILSVASALCAAVAIGGMVYALGTALRAHFACRDECLRGGHHESEATSSGCYCWNTGQAPIRSTGKGLQDSEQSKGQAPSSDTRAQAAR